MWGKKSFFLLALALALLSFQAPANARVEMKLADYIGIYTHNANITGLLNLTYDELISQGAFVAAYVNSNLVSQINISSFLPPASLNNLKMQGFDYKIIADGKTSWKEYPSQAFTFQVTAHGTCGNMQCAPPGGPNTCVCETGGIQVCTPNPTCAWSDNGATLTDSVNGNDGLKFIYGNPVAIPTGHNDDTAWSAISTNPNVTVTMRKACADQYYEDACPVLNGQTNHEDSCKVWKDGFIRKTIPRSRFTQSTGGAWEALIEKFDGNSLYMNRTYGGNMPGGIIKVEGELYLAYGTGAVWNGSTGYIKIFNYDPSATYMITYLPPNGPNLCAYTAVYAENSTSWRREKAISGSDVYCTYLAPYSRNYSESELLQLLVAPGCPSYVSVGDCNKTITSFQVQKTSDPSGTVTVNSDASAKSVGATTSSKALAANYTVLIDMANFSGLRSPESADNVLRLALVDGGAVLANVSASLATCADADGDGYCAGAGDCNDSNPDVHPGAEEICDGIDNNCNGQADEGFQMGGIRLGQTTCGIAGTSCAGVYVCTSDHFNYTCSATLHPGDQPEICNNGIDDDCDGFTDEPPPLTVNNVPENCTLRCTSGNTRPCGSDVGECRKGTQACMNGEWGNCTGNTEPRTETCDGRDNNCNGVIDDVGGSSSVNSTKCGCYGGAPPSAEVCNDIDDNCNGQTDENLVCCKAGETRYCGTNQGICRQGIQRCGNGAWGQCEGAIAPREEICYNNVDDDCDGVIDNPGQCTTAITCNNGVQDVNENGIDCGGPCAKVCQMPFYSWLLIGIVIIFSLLVFWTIAIRTKF